AASPGGERLVGWQSDHGPDRAPDYFPAAQFRASLYRPDVISRLLEAGSLDKALAAADRERGRSGERTEVARALPPRVSLSVPSGRHTAGSPVEVRATAQSVGSHPVTALRLLVDGRPHGADGLRQVRDPKPGEVHE